MNGIDVGVKLTLIKWYLVKSGDDGSFRPPQNLLKEYLNEKTNAFLLPEIQIFIGRG